MQCANNDITNLASITLYLYVEKWFVLFAKDDSKLGMGPKK